MGVKVLSLSYIQGLIHAYMHTVHQVMLHRTVSDPEASICQPLTPVFTNEEVVCLLFAPQQ